MLKLVVYLISLCYIYYNISDCLRVYVVHVIIMLWTALSRLSSYLHFIRLRINVIFIHIEFTGAVINDFNMHIKSLFSIGI